MNKYTAHVDTFARDRLPPREHWPDFIFDLPELQYPDRINCGRVLLDDALAEGHGSRMALYSDAVSLTYDELAAQTNRIANVLVNQMGVVPGNRVLLRAANTPMLVAAWLAVMKVGAVAVTTMPMLRAKELSVIAQRAAIHHALCDARLADELRQAAAGTQLGRIVCWGNGEIESMMQREHAVFAAVDTAQDDVCLLAFTSGTTAPARIRTHRARRSGARRCAGGYRSAPRC